MRKIVLAAILLVATSATMQAQFLRLGVKAGVNFASQRGDAGLNGVAFDKEGITSYHAGLVAELKLLEKFSIQPELLYSTQGATYKNAIQEYKKELGYITVPVMAKFYLTDAFSLELGPQASFLVSEKNDFDPYNAETFEFGLNAGLGFKITKSLFIQGRYGLGLTEASSNADVKNSTVQISAGFMF